MAWQRSEAETQYDHDTTYIVDSCSCDFRYDRYFSEREKAIATC